PPRVRSEEPQAPPERRVLVRFGHGLQRPRHGHRESRLRRRTLARAREAPPDRAGEALSIGGHLRPPAEASSRARCQAVHPHGRGAPKRFGLVFGAKLKNISKTRGPAATPPGARIIGMPVELITTLVVDQHERASPVLASLTRYSWLSIRTGVLGS